MEQCFNIFDQIRNEVNQENSLPYMFVFGKEKYKESNPKEYETIHKFLANHDLSENEEIISVGQKILGFVLIITTDTILVIGNHPYNQLYDKQILDFVKNIRPFDSRFTKEKTIKVFGKKQQLAI